MITGYLLNMYNSISWNTGLAAERARHNLRLKNKKRPAAILALRESLDKILNHSDKLHKGSEMELTKISYVG